MSTSTLYTVGTALSRAQSNQVPVEVLVGGHWLAGDVLAVDGVGVVLSPGADEHVVVRIEAVQAVRVGAAAPDEQGRAGTPPHVVYRPVLVRGTAVPDLDAGE